MPSNNADLSDMMDAPAKDDDTGEDVEVDQKKPEIDEDGSAVVDISDKDDESAEQDQEFYANLAEKLSDSELSAIAMDLLDKIEIDKDSRKQRDEKYAEGLRRTGLGDDAPGGAQFEGASKVVHPLLTEVAVDFSARAIKELFPSGGPAKEYIPGTVNKAKVEKAQRKTKWLNWQATEQMPEFRADLEQLLTQLPLGGSQYMKIRYDERKLRPVAEFVPIDDVYVPFAASTFYTAERKTHVQKLTGQEFEARVRSGMYRDINLVSPMQPDETSAQRANQKIEGKTPDGMNVDDVRVVYEVQCQYDVTDSKRKEDGPAPYIITIDDSTNSVIAVYRNWDEEDPAQEELQHIVEFLFVPWRGAYGIGMTHMIGGLTAAATGTLRALLDSALINNFPGGVKMKGGPMGGQNVRVDPTNVNELDGAAGLIDDIRKMYMNIPVNQPSPALVTLLSFLVDAGKSVIKTTLDEDPDGSANVPVGTQMSRVEQGMMVFSAIHARMHTSMKRVLQVMHRINKTYLNDKQVLRLTGEQMTTRADFNGAMDVIPVSDPNIFSEIQRFAQIQTIAQRAQLMPQLYDQYKVEMAILERMKVPDPKSFLVPKPEPVLANAVNENIAMALGRPVVAFPLQDHLAHVKAHIDFFLSPLFGQSPQIGGKFTPAFIQHVTEHVLLWYAVTCYNTATEANNGEDISSFMDTKDPEVEQAFDRMIEAANAKVLAVSPQYIGNIPQVIQQAQQLMQKLAPPPPPPMDPAHAQIQVAQLNNTTKQQQLQQQDKQFQLKQQQEQQAAAQALQAKTAQQQSQSSSELQRTGIEASTKVQTTEMDNTTAQTIAAAEIAAGKHTNIRNGESIGGKGV
jgi:hypothetical protein